MKFQNIGGTLIGHDEESLKALAKLEENQIIDIEFIKDKQRTKRQNRALHLYLAMVSEALNEAGLDMVKVLKEGTEIPWTPPLVKKHIWKQVQDAMLDKNSTTQLTTSECNPVYEVVHRYLSSTFGVTVLWPSYLDKAGE